MARGGGIALKSLQMFLRVIEFCCSVVALALFAYFLAALNSRGYTISNYARAVTGLAGAATIYTAFGFFLVCCLGGFGFFALLAVLLDILFIGAFIFIAYENRTGASSCNGNVNTIFGSGNTYTDVIVPPQDGLARLPSLHQACQMQTAVLAVSIVACVFFLLSAIGEIAMWRHHKSEKKYGPGPNNGYTTGSGNRKFWQRKPRDATLAAGGVGAKEGRYNGDALPAHHTPADVRQSYATDNTMVGPEPVAYNKYGHVGNAGVGDGYAAPAVGHHPAQHGGVTVPNELPASRY